MSAITKKTDIHVLDDEPTLLKIGQTYSLKRSEFAKEPPNASLLKNVRPSGGSGYDFEIYPNSDVKIGYHVDTLARSVLVELNMTRWGWIVPAELQTILMFRDLNSDEADFVRQEFQSGEWTKVTLPLRVKDGEVRFSIEPGNVGSGRSFGLTSIRIEEIQ